MFFSNCLWMAFQSSMSPSYSTQSFKQHTRGAACLNRLKKAEFIGWNVGINQHLSWFKAIQKGHPNTVNSVSFSNTFVNSLCNSYEKILGQFLRDFFSNGISFSYFLKKLFENWIVNFQLFNIPFKIFFISVFFI